MGFSKSQFSPFEYTHFRVPFIAAAKSPAANERNRAIFPPSDAHFGIAVQFSY
jgi:hypothetical protein